MDSFLSFLDKKYPEYANTLTPHKPGTSGFNQKWKSLASSNADGFEKVQHDFIKSSHYDPAKSRVEKLGLDIDSKSKAVKDALWSTAVQHGSYGAYKVFKNAGIKEGMTDEQIIRRLYEERKAENGMRYFPSSSPSIRQSVVNRFDREMKDALKMLKG